MSTETVSHASSSGESNAIEKVTLSDLVSDLEYPGGIRIPMIQRDYAQGRDSWANPRKRFLKDIREALMPGGKPLHLDFVYGVKDQLEAFCPLDGQQRLTTLFLLHWYLATRDGCFGEFQVTFQTEAKESKFTYQVRPGGRSFFQSLVKHTPEIDVSRISEPAAWMREQSWFRTIWERDPSVAGALVMLDAIHLHFKNSQDASYEQLVNGDRITFQRHDLKAAGLHDDLYLRMNARGRPLSSFETFKARYEKYLETSFPDTDTLGHCKVKTTKDFSDSVDKEWLDFIWNYYGSKNSSSEDTSSVDEGFINLFRTVALVSLQATREDTKKKITKKDAASKDSADVRFLSGGEPNFDDFENGGWLTTDFTIHLIHVLEACKPYKERDSDLERDFILFQNPWFKDGRLLDRIVRHEGTPELADFLQFAACVRFLTTHGLGLDGEHLTEFENWNRVVRNLTLNSDVRADTFLDMLSGLNQLIEGCGNGRGILMFLAGLENKIPGFNEDQTREESLKAALWPVGNSWQTLITEAENHPYFRGQIGFLLDFSGAEAVRNSDCPQDHLNAQNHFRRYLTLAEEMFGGNGLREQPKENGYLWQRALLAVGDYRLHYSGERWSLLDPGRTSSVSWKRYLADDHHGKRRHLKDLWDRVDVNSIETSLRNIVEGATIEEPWRKTLCSTPEVWVYCKDRIIQFIDRGDKIPPRVYLLSRTIRSTAYEELNSFCFRKKVGLPINKLPTDTERFSPFKYAGGDYVSGSYHPHLKFEFEYKGKGHVFQLYCHCWNDAGFSLRIHGQELDPDFKDFLIRTAGFEPEPQWQPDCLTKHQNPEDPLDGAAFLDSIAAHFRLAEIPS